MSSDDLYNGIGMVFVLLAPLIGGSTLLLKSVVFAHFLDSFAGGILLEAALLHSLPDAVEVVILTMLYNTNINSILIILYSSNNYLQQYY
jgi:ABC-type uncharacterized transport system permease subunit